MVKKKIKKSSARNRVRRLLKESYRLNKTELLSITSGKEIKLRILFTLSGTAYTDHRQLTFRAIEPDMIKLLSKIKKLTENKI
ncbi:MAG: ribonuclease P protein component [Ignavibacteria bacterium]|nr:ribonuclease P protein component [Ignavibacteria bacterium]